MAKKAKNTSQLHRYPGIQPFSRDYRDVFFGRSSDIEGLYKYLNVNNLVVLYGKSGLGKSSLLNAGLIPTIEERQQYKTIFIRFGSYHADQPSQLNNIFNQKITDALPDGQSTFFPELEIDHDELSIWQNLKALEWAYKEQQGVLLVLDQFEEVFTYPNGEVEEFAKEFSEVINNRMPEVFRRKLYEQAEKDPGFLEKNGDRVEFIDQPAPLKILIGIRSDRLSLVDRFSSYLPNILKNTYELSPLDLDQAKRAIVSPAIKPGDFISPPFTYERHFLDIILAYLSKDGSRPIETFLLQIICQYIEDRVIASGAKPGEAPIEVKQSDIGNLDSIARSYYIDVIQGKDNLTGEPRFDEHEQLMVRHFIETNLIDPVHHNRISLDKTFVEQKGLTDGILAKLVNARITRQEPNTVSGVSYELSHDTLIDPVLQSAQQLGNIEDQIEAYYRHHVDRPLQRFIETYFISPEGQVQHFNPNDFEDVEAPLNTLKEARLVRELGDDQYELYQMFRTPALKFKAEREVKKLEQERSKRRRVTLIAIMGFLLALIAVMATVFAFKQSKKAEVARMEALAQRELAIVEKNKSDSLKTLADEEKERAQIFAEEAKAQEKIAVVAKDKAETARLQALTERDRAEREKVLADQARAEALQQQRLTLIEKNRADSLLIQANKAREQAIAALQEAERAKELAESRLAEIAEKNREIDYQDKFITVQPFLTRARDVMERNPTAALRIAEHAYQLEQIDSTENLLYSILAQDSLRFYDKVLRGHQSTIYRMAISPNGQTLASGDDNGNVILWNIATGRQVGKLEGHSNNIWGLAFTSDGKQLVSGSWDNTAKLWDVQTGRLMQTFSGHTAGIKKLAISPDNKILATCGRDSTLRLWDMNSSDLKSGKQLDIIREPGEVHSVCFSADGQTIAVGSSKTVTLWDVKKLKKIKTFSTDLDRVEAVILTPDGKTLITGNWALTANDESLIIIWDIETGEQRYIIREYHDTVWDMFLSSDSDYLLPATDEPFLCLWDLKEVKKVLKIPTSSNGSYSGALTPDGNYIIADEKYDIKFWHREIPTVRQEIIDNYKNRLPFAQSRELIQTFLSSNQVIQLTLDEKIEYGIISKKEAGK